MRAAKRLTAAVIGTGQIAQQHLDFLSSSAGIQVVGVSDLSLAVANYVAKRNHILGVFTDYRRMLEEKTPDVVHVLTPPQTHVRIVRDCLDAGAHVIVEKPIAPTHAEFGHLWETACRQGRLLIEDHNYKFNDPMIALSRLWKGGAIGEIKEIEIRIVLRIRAEGGRYADRNLPHPSHTLPAGALHEFISHMCYLALCFIPYAGNDSFDDYEHVTATWRNVGGGPVFKYDDLDANFEARRVRVRLRFSSETWPECFTVTIRGASGFAETDLFQPYLRLEIPRSAGPFTPILNQWSFGAHLKRTAWRNLFDKLMQKDSYHGLTRFLLSAYRAISTGTEPPVTFEDMDRTSRLIDALVATGGRR